MKSNIQMDELETDGDEEEGLGWAGKAGALLCFLHCTLCAGVCV